MLVEQWVCWAAWVFLVTVFAWNGESVIHVEDGLFFGEVTRAGR